MTNIIIQISKYIIILLMAAYTFSCFSIFTRNYEDEEKRVLIRQDVLLFLLQMVAFFARICVFFLFMQHWLLSYWE